MSYQNPNFQKDETGKYYCYWATCVGFGKETENAEKSRFIVFKKLSKCLEYVDTIKYVTNGEYGHEDINDEGAHYIEIGSKKKVFLRLYHHWDDVCNLRVNPNDYPDYD